MLRSIVAGCSDGSWGGGFRTVWHGFFSSCCYLSIVRRRGLIVCKCGDIVSGGLFGREEGEGEVFGGGGTGAGGFLEGGVTAVEGVLGLFAVEDLLDGEDLNRLRKNSKWVVRKRKPSNAQGLRKSPRLRVRIEKTISQGLKPDFFMNGLWPG